MKLWCAQLAIPQKANGRVEEVQKVFVKEKELLYLQTVELGRYERESAKM